MSERASEDHPCPKQLGDLSNLEEEEGTGSDLEDARSVCSYNSNMSRRRSLQDQTTPEQKAEFMTDLNGPEVDPGDAGDDLRNRYADPQTGRKMIAFLKDEIGACNDQERSRKMISRVVDLTTADSDTVTSATLLECCMIYLGRYRDDFESYRRVVDRCGTTEDLIDVLEYAIEQQYSSDQFDNVIALVEMYRDGQLTVPRRRIILRLVIRSLGGQILREQILRERTRAAAESWFIQLAEIAVDPRDSSEALDAARDLRMCIQRILTNTREENEMEQLSHLVDNVLGAYQDRLCLICAPDRNGVRYLPPAFSESIVYWGRHAPIQWLIRRDYRFSSIDLYALANHALQFGKAELINLLLDLRHRQLFEITGALNELMNAMEYGVPLAINILDVAMIDPRACSTIHCSAANVIAMVVSFGQPKDLSDLLHHFTTTDEHRACYCMDHDQPPIHTGPIQFSGRNHCVVLTLLNLPFDEHSRAMAAVLASYSQEHDLPFHYRLVDHLILISHSPSLTQDQILDYDLIPDLDSPNYSIVPMGNQSIVCFSIDSERPATMQDARAACSQLTYKSARSAC